MAQSGVDRNSPSSNSLLIGLDVGGTKIEASAVDSRLHMLSRVVVPAVIDTPDAFAASVLGATEEALRQAAGQSDAPRRAAAMGIGVPGQVDRATGVMRNAVNLGLVDYPLGDVLRARFDCPIVLENDVRLAALGAFYRLRQQDPARIRHADSLAYLSIGTGFAAGLVLNGRLYRGRRGMAGELGHVQVDPAGPPCNCGAAGCAETYLSGAGLVRLAQDVLAQRPDSSLHALGARPGARDVFAAARQGDEVAALIIDRFADRLTRLLYATQLAYDVDTIILGGGVAKAGEVLMDAVQRQVAALRTRLPLARTLLDPERISTISDQNMGIWGGIMLAADARLNEEQTDHDRHPAVSLDQEQPLS